MMSTASPTAPAAAPAWPAARVPPPPPRRAPGAGVVASGRRLLGVAVWTASGLAALVVLAVIALPAVGLRGFTVLSGSMSPTIAVGDMVVVRPVAPATVTAGAVVTFTDPERPGRLVTHRLERATRVGGRYDMVTRGDANTMSERWSVPADGRVGHVVATVPRIGWVLAWSRSPAGRLLGLVAPAVFLGLWALGRIWRPVRR